MKRLIAICLCAAPAWAEPVAVPSGQPVTFVEVIRDVPGTVATTWRFRFIAPQISRDRASVSIDTAIADMDALCTDFVLPQLADAQVPPDQVIISLSDRAVEFGVANPDATQFFEAYRVEASHCIWEGM